MNQKRHSPEWWCGVVGAVLCVIGCGVVALCLFGVIDSILICTTSGCVLVFAIFLLLISVKQDLDDLAEFGRQHKDVIDVLKAQWEQDAHKGQKKK